MNTQYEYRRFYTRGEYDENGKFTFVETSQVGMVRPKTKPLYGLPRYGDVPPEKDTSTPKERAGSWWAHGTLMKWGEYKAGLVSWKEYIEFFDRTFKEVI